MVGNAPGDGLKSTGLPLLPVLKTDAHPGVDISREYRRRFSGNAAYRDAVWSTINREFFQQFVKETDTVLDLGAGWGEFIRTIRAARRLALDLNAEMPTRVGPGVEAFVHDFRHPWPLAEASVDVVFSSNVFEHMPDKDTLQGVLAEALRVLRPGGTLVCIGPNIRFLPDAYWDFWDHHVPLSDRSLAEVLELTGFTLRSVVPRFLPYTMSQGFQPPTCLIRWYLRLPLLWRVFGKQFLVVASKPAMLGGPATGMA